MRIVHTIATLSPQAAGVFHFVNGLARHQRQLGHEIVVIGLGGTGNATDASLWESVKTEQVPTRGPGFFPFAPAFARVLAEQQPDIVHCHGLWTYHGLTVPAFCRRRGIPYVVSPHGMLEPWAWRHKAWKKRPIWWAWERRFVRNAAALHATAQPEGRKLASLGFKGAVAVVPVGLETPLPPTREILHGNKRTILFLSRIYPVKGLLSLVQAWRQLRPAGWEVVVAGPDQAGHLAEVKTAARNGGVESDFRFVGPVQGDRKWELLRSADLFVLPSLSENFGVVVIEALASEVPVITTKGTPWEELGAHRCGWWVDVGVESLVAALREAMSLSDEQRQEMGRRGRRLVQERYAWPRIALDTVGVCDWILKGGKPPEVVLQ